jgi:hypothetical protein
MAPNAEANSSQVLAHFATPDEDSGNSSHDRFNTFSLRRGAGDRWWHRSRSGNSKIRESDYTSSYAGAVLFNTAAFILSALYTTLVKI